MRQYKLIILLALMFTALSQTSMAQFKVMASSGSSTINGKKAYVGSPVTANSKIVVPAKSYISLLHPKSRGTVEISKAGTYQASSLETELLKRSGQSTGQRFANYIIGELTKSGGKEIHKNPYRYSNVTGSVERGNPGDIVVLMPKTTPAFGNQYLIQWNPVSNADGYQLEILNDFDEVAKVLETKETSILVDLNMPELEGFDIAKMRVAAANDKSIASTYFALTKPDEESLKAIQKELNGINLSEQSNAMDLLLAAQVFEHNKFYADAIKAYQQAIKMEPDFDPLQIAYNQFLIRSGLVKAEELASTDESGE